MNADGYACECTVCGKRRMSGANPLKNGWPTCCGYTMRLVDEQAFIKNVDAEVGACFGFLARKEVPS